MEYHLERKIRLKQSEHESLYEWSLQELDENNEQIGEDQLPWEWSLEFTATELKYIASVGQEDDGYVSKENYPTDIEPDTIHERERIEATLLSGEFRDGVWHEGPTFSMFGTRRNIKNMNLIILSLNDESFTPFPKRTGTERCNIWGGVSNTIKWEGGDINQDDYLTVYLLFQPDRFRRLAKAVRKGGWTGAILSLSSVSGFYSDWSPDIPPNWSKVLASAPIQEVIVDGERDVVPYRLKEVGEFDFQLFSSISLPAHKEILKAQQESARELYGEDDRDEELDPNFELVAQLKASRKAIRRLYLPLWLIFVALVALVIQQV